MVILEDRPANGYSCNGFMCEYWYLCCSDGWKWVLKLNGQVGADFLRSGLEQVLRNAPHPMLDM
jgi:hypothetical protein